MRNQVKSALRYPGFVIVVMAVALALGLAAAALVLRPLLRPDSGTPT